MNLQSDSTNDSPAVWEISFNTAAGTSFFVNRGQAMSFSGTPSTTARGASLNLTWKGLQYLPSGLANILSVTINGRTVAPYGITARLGQSGMGEAYHATDQSSAARLLSRFCRRPRGGCLAHYQKQSTWSLVSYIAHDGIAAAPSGSRASR